MLCDEAIKVRVCSGTHVAGVGADHTVAAPGAVQIARGLHGNAAWPRVALRHRTGKRAGPGPRGPQPTALRVR